MKKGKKTRNYFVQLVLNGVIGVFENSHPRRVRKKISCGIFQSGSHGDTIIGKAQNLKCILVTCASSNLIKDELVSWLGDFRFYRTLAKSFSTNDLSRYVHSTKSPAGYASIFFSSFGCKKNKRVVNQFLKMILGNKHPGCLPYIDYIYQFSYVAMYTKIVCI